MSSENTQQSAGFKWTGHPFIDYGIATIMAWCDLAEPNNEPEDITVQKLREVLQNKEIIALKSFASSIETAFTLNHFRNPSLKEDKQKQRVKNFLMGFELKSDNEFPRCTFFDLPSVNVLERDTFPLLSAQGQVNFYAEGDPGIAVSGQAMTAIFMIIFGALRSAGKLMIVSADDKNLLKSLLANWVQLIRRELSLYSDDPENFKNFAPPKTALITTLTNLEEARAFSYSGGVTIYHFSNSGKGRPSIAIYKLPAPILNFVLLAQGGEQAAGWAEIRRRWWSKSKDKRKPGMPENSEPNEAEQYRLNNRFFDDLFKLPQGSGQFVRQYFLQTLDELLQIFDSEDSKKALSIKSKVKGISILLGLFMEEVLNMDAQRINDIRNFADRLGEAVLVSPKYLAEIFKAKRNSWSDVRRVIIYIIRKELERGQSPLTGLNQFLSIFEVSENFEYQDFTLAWDLVKIRMMEYIFERDNEFFKKGSIKELIDEDMADVSSFDTDSLDEQDITNE